MKENRIIPLVALIVAVVGLGIGFAAFTSTLTISSKATVTPVSDFHVGFSTVSSDIVAGTVKPSNESTLGTDATLTETSVSGINATFTEPGQSVTYNFYLVNRSQYLAYLNAITFGTKTCTPGSGTTASLVTAACNGISIDVRFGGNKYTQTVADIDGVSYNTADITGVIVTITYASGSTRADGPFNVSFGDITARFDTYDD